MNQLPEGWQLLSSTYLHKEPWLTVRQDRLALPNGHIIEKYFVLEYPDWINVIAITKEGQFVLIRQYRHGIGLSSYELCAGVIDPTDESPLAAAQRELLEETGYGGGVWEPWMVSAPNPATSNNWVHCFVATGVEKISNTNQEPSEDISVHLFSAEELRSLIASGDIIQATHLTGLWKFVALAME